MRLFTAIDLPEGFRDELAEVQSPSALDARWTDPDQFHVTLRFIGDTAPDDSRRYEEALADVTGSPARCTPYGLDVLPSRRSPKVLVLGLERTGSLLSLYDDVEAALNSEGVDPEDRKYRPHVTLARLDDTPPEAAHAYLRNQDAMSFPAFEATRFILYESTLTSNGAVHEPQAVFSLNG
jgi:2'-5' RNA ligase